MIYPVGQFGIVFVVTISDGINVLAEFTFFYIDSILKRHQLCQIVLTGYTFPNDVIVFPCDCL